MQLGAVSFSRGLLQLGDVSFSRYSLSHAECSLLLLLDMFCFSSLRQDGLLLLCE